MAERIIKKNQALFKRAEKVLVGGVDSPVRSFSYVGSDPLVIRRGRGSKVYDYDGNSYIDYVLSWGSAILGHANPAVIQDLKKTATLGLSFGTTNDKEIELAEAISSASPFIENIRFVSSGTEAVMGAIRLSRGYTKRDKILKFENFYHGHADYLLAKGGSGLATLGIPASKGVPEDFTKHTLIATYGDKSALAEIFKREGKNIAAVIVEPVGANYGVVEPDLAFLKELRSVTKKYGSLLIFDEVITGFRFRYGLIAKTFGITPDLVTLGKIIGGGLPIGAYGGSGCIMKELAPLGKVYQASTFSGNPVVMQAGLSTLKTLKDLRNDYKRLSDLTQSLTKSLEIEAKRRNIGLKARSYENIFSLKFDRIEEFKQFYVFVLGKGIYFAQSEFEANFLSFAHTKKDIDKTIRCAKEAFDELK